MLAGFNKRSAALLVKTCAVLFSALMTLSPAAQAKVVKTENNPHLSKCAPVIQWRDDTLQPRAVAIAIHGLVMHGGVYDAMATSLAEQGIVVIAPDMRGYGHWVDHGRRHDSLATPVDYKKSHEDMVTLARNIKSNYPGIPFFAIGESLGADMALRLAADQPNMINGLILSAPAVKHRSYVAEIVRTAPAMLSNPFGQIDLAHHIQRRFSNDSRISSSTVCDPLVRKTLSVMELLRTSGEAKKCLKYARNITGNVPVLVMQGGDDQMVRGEAVRTLLKALPAYDQKLAWFESKGHLLLETQYVAAQTMKVVSNWLNDHVDTQIQISAGVSLTAEEVVTTKTEAAEAIVLAPESEQHDKLTRLALEDN